ncbi:TonB-dependent receptor plug domain-containing protein [Zobellia galactanivorans]|uniref:Vitamin B12 TonB-dependent receptor n=1 Tax=Zobellia galactanivorans (strain DSM 12802 / CCUG 47099 / CIP 106680 / NCIMB 13871 / Dsij) TaxID=63186 RepID=G0KZV0_ZOBGA|nr:TonB-dependent receptor plug domain-containing protein [Zobellia galactanivorans]CAZ94129.1 Vitamin B12 TonB-dependent receptor [Zobellia galactanivorans]
MNKNFYGVCAALLASTSMIAQNVEGDSTKVRQLDEVVVSDSKFELKRENSGKTVIKITAEELERYQGKNITEIINNQSGIEISGSRSPEGSVFGVYARGGRGRQVLVIVDGVRVLDPSSFSEVYDLRLLSAASVESIEIIKGAASTLYGTNAATAVINITTKKASVKPISLSVQSSVGTNQTQDDQNYNVSRSSNSAQISGTLNKFNYSGSFSNRYAEGISANITPANEEDPFSNISTNLRLGYDFSDKLKVSVYGNQTKVNTNFDNSYGPTDAPNQFISKQERAGVAATYDYGRGSLRANAGYSSYDSENITDFPSTFKGNNYVVDVYHKYNFNDQFHSVVGLNYLADETDFLAKEKFEITDPYANVVYVSDFGLNLNAGARLNNHTEYGTNFVYNINPSFTLKMDGSYLKFLTSYATSYITPSLTQLFGNYGANPDLEPEDDRTIEGGLEFAGKGNFRASALYFNRKEENFVFYDNATSSYKNALNTIDAQGVEVELSWKAADKLNFDANYTFTERKGDDAVRIPKHKINANLGYAFSDRAFASLNYSLTGSRTDSDFSTFPSTIVPLDSFSLVDLYLSHECIENRLKVFLNVNNILNQEYTEALGFTTKGRNVMIGFSLNL